MSHYLKFACIALLVAGTALQAGCDQDAIPDAQEDPTVGKTLGGASLADELAADPEFRKLQKLLHKADVRVRLKYSVRANLKRDLAFAKSLEHRTQLASWEKARVRKIRGLDQNEFDEVSDLRDKILQRYPDLLSMAEEELKALLTLTGTSSAGRLGKVLINCDECKYSYNNCISDAEFRHSIEVMGCILLAETLFAGTACYLASVSKYLYTVSTCNQRLQYCLNANGCYNKAARDTI